MLASHFRAFTLLKGIALGTLITATIPTVATADPLQIPDLTTIAEQVLTTESTALLPASSRTMTSAATTPELQGKLAARLAIQSDRDYARQLAGAQFTDGTTSVRVLSTTGSTRRQTAEIEERTAYTTPDGSSDYTYTAHHKAVFTWDNGWKLADISSPDPTSPVSDAQIDYVTQVPAEVRQATIRAQIVPLRESLARNRTALLAGDAAKTANQRVAVGVGDGYAGPSPSTTGAGTRVGPTAGNARPADRPLPMPDSVVTPLGGEGAPYDYVTMVDFALHYATDHAVTYTRDTNDCTTFISWTLWTGRYSEFGSDSYPAVAWNYDDHDVWYWRCNDCSPKHSHTWGGAKNWNIFENNYGGRVTFLQYLDDLLISDVMQLEIDGYGETDAPDHTMMVTGRGSDGWPLLSYHSTDTTNKPFWDILAVHDGPYWAIRT